MNTDEIKSLIQNGLVTSFVNVVGDGTHFEAIIVSNEFDSALGDAMKEAIHALSMKTYTQEQWENIQQKGA